MDIGYKTTILPLSHVDCYYTMWVLWCKMYIENCLGLEWLNAMATTDQPPQGRLVEVEPPVLGCILMWVCPNPIGLSVAVGTLVLPLHLHFSAIK